MKEDIKVHKLISNGDYSIVSGPYPHEQHPNQQKGLDEYVDVLDHNAGVINQVKLYMNTKGKHFKKSGNHYLRDFKKPSVYVPYQIFVEEN